MYEKLSVCTQSHIELQILWTCESYSIPDADIRFVRHEGRSPEIHAILVCEKRLPVAWICACCDLPYISTYTESGGNKRVTSTLAFKVSHACTKCFPARSSNDQGRAFIQWRLVNYRKQVRQKLNLREAQCVQSTGAIKFNMKNLRDWTLPNE